MSSFIDSLIPGAKENYSNYGILPSITIGQAILENGADGNSELARKYNNLFGIKGTGDAGTVSLPTTEYVGGKPIKLMQNFKVYSSPDASIKDYGKLLGTDKIYSGVITPDYKKASYALQNAGYGTDPSYANKLNNIIASNDLTKYDTGSYTGSTTETTEGSKGMIESIFSNINADLKKAGFVVGGLVVGTLGLYLLFKE